MQDHIIQAAPYRAIIMSHATLAAKETHICILHRDKCLYILAHWGWVRHICVGKLTIIVNWTVGNKFQWNLNWNLYIFIHENALENVVCKMVSILSRPQCANTNPEECLNQHQCKVTELEMLPWPAHTWKLRAIHSSFTTSVSQAGDSFNIQSPSWLVSGIVWHITLKFDRYLDSTAATTS